MFYNLMSKVPSCYKTSSTYQIMFLCTRSFADMGHENNVLVVFIVVSVRRDYKLMSVLTMSGNRLAIDH